MAVINRTERCLVGKMCHNVQGIVLFFAIVCCGLTAITATEPRRSCDLVKKDVEQMLKVQTPKVLDRPQTGVLCGESCCTRELEKEAYKHNQQSVHKYIRSSILKVSSIISNRARKFDELFRAMMNNSKREFHEMFERTYGKIYLKNSDVFSDFLGELETYYKKGTIRLSETMDTFFGILYQRMFTVINAQYTFDERYLECVSDHMAEMKPFGDVPHKLGIQLRRSFVATRTFYKSLIKGAEAANRLAELNVDDECYKESTKMRFCGLCKGEANGKPCSSYCTSTMRECFMYHMQFSTFWDNFVDAIDKVGDRLLGPYNIEIVVEPLNIKISEAIMNFQESGADVSKKIYNKCGKPMFSRPKRKADYKNASEDNPNTEIKIKPMKGHGKKRKHKKVMEGPDMKSTLEKIIIDIKQKIKETKQFWLNLPHQFCNTLSITPTNDTELCRNATTPMYDRPQTKSLDAGNSILDEQTYILQGLTDKLRKAHQGQEVEIVDDTEEALAGGSEGSGSGSGDGGDMEIEETGRSGIKDIIFNENPDESVPEEAVPTVPATTSSTQTPEVVRASGTSNANDMSLTRALIQYLLPMVLVWFGGAISNLL